MQKILTLYERDRDTGHVVPRVNPGCEWLFEEDGGGIPTVKWDGTCCRVIDGALYKRYEYNPERRFKVYPEGFIASAGVDPFTNKQHGWVPISGTDPADQWHREAWNHAMSFGAPPMDWTYELVGPKVQGNPYHLTDHILVRHGADLLMKNGPALPVSLTFEALQEYLYNLPFEGIVWWSDLTRPDCLKIKLKRRDYGYPWPYERSRIAYSPELG